MNYALHFGLLNDDRDQALDAKEHITGINAMWLDGDAFHVWGEDRETWGGAEHVVVEFNAPDHEIAVRRGKALFSEFVSHGVADPEATCMPDRNGEPSAEEHVPFAITSAAVWSAALDLETGQPDERTLADWEDALTR